MGDNPVFFDDKSVQMFVTPDKWVNRFYPGITPAFIPSKDFFHDEQMKKKIGHATEIDKHTHVLYYQPFTPSENVFNKSGEQREIYWLNPETKIMEVIVGIKFPQITLDRHTNYVHMHYWANVKKADAVVGKQPVVGLEPYNELTGEVTDYKRVVCFARGQLYACFESVDGGPPVFQPTYIFESPQIVVVSEIWNPTNTEGEPVLDIHPYKKLFFFKDYVQTDEKTPDTNKYGTSDRQLTDYYEEFNPYQGYQKQLWLEFLTPVKNPRAVIIPSMSMTQEVHWNLPNACVHGFPGVFTDYVSFAMIRVPLAAGVGNTWGLDKLKWSNAAHKTAHNPVASTFFSNAANFVDFYDRTPATCLMGGQMAWGGGSTNPPVGDMSRATSEEALAYTFNGDDITNLGDSTYYGMCIFFNLDHECGNWYDMASLAGAAGNWGNIVLELTGYPKDDGVIFPSFGNAFGLVNNFGIVKEP